MTDPEQSLPGPHEPASSGDSHPTSQPEAQPTSPRRAPAQSRGLLLVLFSCASTQAGAGFGTMAIPAVGPFAVVGMRQLIGALVLLPIARPPVRSYRWPQWYPVLLLSFALATMNTLLYVSFGLIDIGLAVTLEFLGPLVLGILGSRTVIDLACALLAGVGVYVLVLPGADVTGDNNVLGIALALGAGVAWAGYILATRKAAQSLPGVEGSSLAMGINTLVFAPLLIALLWRQATVGDIGWSPFALAALAGLLSSAIPYGLDNMALRWLPAPVFAVLMSTQPVFAALSGLLLLGQVLAVHEWAGIVVIVTANAIGVYTRSRRPARPG